MCVLLSIYFYDENKIWHSFWEKKSVWRRLATHNNKTKIKMFDNMTKPYSMELHFRI